MSAGHTPGPWEAGRECISGTVAVWVGDRMVAQAGGRHITADQSRIDAHLIAAAPDLLTELAASTAEMMGIVQRIEDAGLGNLVGGCARQCDLNRAAIAKATGTDDHAQHGGSVG